MKKALGKVFCAPFVMNGILVLENFVINAESY